LRLLKPRTESPRRIPFIPALKSGAFWCWGKTLILKAGKDYITASIPGHKDLDKNKIKKVLNL